MTNTNIEKVAIYLRKSRQEEGMSDEETLHKHRKELVDLVESKGWQYDIFQEVGTSQDIEYRPEFSKLMERIKAGYYSAVVAIELSRISRGSESLVIVEKFQERNVIIVTPNKTYDPNNESDKTLIEAELFGSRLEYQFIKKRLNEGKKRSARMGQWTNGVAPIGYRYNRDTKKLEIREDESETIRLIYDLYLDGQSQHEIGFELNRRGITTRNGAFYQSATIGRILRNPVYIGSVVYGKSEGSGHLHKKSKPLQFKDESKWIRVDDAHPAIVGKEQFNEVQRQLKKRDKIPSRAKAGTFTTSGLLKCGKCGGSLPYRRRKLASGNYVVYVHSCGHMDVYGNRCTNSGIRLDFILKHVKNEVDRYENELTSNRTDGQEVTKNRIQRKINGLKKEIDNMNGAFDRIKKLFINGMIDENEMNEEAESVRNKLDAKNYELREARREYDEVSDESNHLKLQRIAKLKEHFDEMNPESKKANELLKELIERITFEREGNQINIDVEFL
ncbi:hypothetical protein FH966_00665 [Lentibacillus cibarius]|uniref:Recombinase family protein n=1 Tax=Lentibacillus cibarius TaxID=2583219 RepID=A0A549YEN0_9BACI|nr:recombinase family protein [Lentibacillus cibarius]TRM10349.1 hypothetical protein FH966_00665 [Lentibacillus cibarius]